MVPFFYFYHYNLFMVKKNIKKHSFLEEEPIFLFWGNETYVTDPYLTIGSNINTHINPSFTLNNNTGDSIFIVNENEIVWRGQTLVTEERVREIVEGQMRELGLI